jgi:glutamate-5-semialdehyde dehydrogenase
MTNELSEKALLARQASRRLAVIGTEKKNQTLKNVAAYLLQQQGKILEANAADCQDARESGMSAAMLDRLVLNEDRLRAMAADVLAVADLPDPIGEVFDMRTLPNGLMLGKKRVPLGVVAAIYESRPNVTIDIASLCLKSGNAVILRGGKETVGSNKALAEVLRQALQDAGAPVEAVQFIENTDHALVGELIKMRSLIDLVVPRGGEGLIKFVRDNASVPVIAGGVGVCHAFIDKTADPDMAEGIVYNAKVQRPSVCNALDTILIHQDIAAGLLPRIASSLNKAGVELHCDERSLEILKAVPGLKLKAAENHDWGKEYLALIAAVKV